MSYNITDWNTKRLENLIIPLRAFYQHPRNDWHPQGMIQNPETNEVELSCGCEQSIKGVLAGNQLLVTEIDMEGEGSGTFFSWILEPALRASEGELIAVLIWEGGDTIERLTVKDGDVKTERIEL